MNESQQPLTITTVKKDRAFDRKELQNLRGRAVYLADVTLSPHWINAYWDLADAADKLDAMIVRTEEKEQ